MLYLYVMMQRLAENAKNEKGAALAEYGLLVALIAVVCIGAITLLGGNIAAAFNNIAGAIN